MTVKTIVVVGLLACLFGIGCTKKSDPAPKRQTIFANIHDAAGAGNTNAVESFLDNGVDVDALDDHGESALHHAAKYGKPAVVSLLLKRKANANIAVPHTGDTPLHYAVMWKRWGIVEMLLKHGAREVANADGVTPRDYAIQQNHAHEYSRCVSTGK